MQTVPGRHLRAHVPLTTPVCLTAGGSHGDLMDQLPVQTYLTDLSTFRSGDRAFDNALNAKAQQIAKDYGASTGDPIRVLCMDDCVLVFVIAADGRALGVGLTSDEIKRGLAG